MRGGVELGVINTHGFVKVYRFLFCGYERKQEDIPFETEAI